MEFTVRDNTVAEFYTKTSTEGNSGYDLYLPADLVFPANAVTFVNFGVAAKTVAGSGYWLLPRSSLSKTPLRLANSVGLIDPLYRGDLIGAFHNTADQDITIQRGTRLAQIALPTLMPFHIHRCASLDETSRGSGGFGSTGEINYIR